MQAGLYGTLGMLSIIMIGLSLNLFAYYLWRKTSNIYKLKSITLKDDSFCVSYNDFPWEEKILYKNIHDIYFKNAALLKPKGSELGLYYVIEYENLNKQQKKLSVPLDLYNISEFINIIYEKIRLNSVANH